MRATRAGFHSSATFPCPAGAGTWRQGPSQPLYVGLLQNQMSTVGDVLVAVCRMSTGVEAQLLDYRLQPKQGLLNPTRQQSKVLLLCHPVLFASMSAFSLRMGLCLLL